MQTTGCGLYLEIGLPGRVRQRASRHAGYWGIGDGAVGPGGGSVVAVVTYLVKLVLE